MKQPMTDDEMLHQCNLAWRENRIADWHMWLSLFHVIQTMGPGARKLASEAFAEITPPMSREEYCRQREHQQDYLEYVEEMSLGGSTYRP